MGLSAVEGAKFPHTTRGNFVFTCYNIPMGKYITQNPAILGGKPIISGTRMSVEAILELLASGIEIKEITKEYPFLKKAQVQAAIDYATKVVSREEKYIKSLTIINEDSADSHPY